MRKRIEFQIQQLVSFIRGIIMAPEPTHHGENPKDFRSEILIIMKHCE